MKNLSDPNHFRSRGNILALLAGCALILFFVVSLGLTVYFYFWAQNRLQLTAERFATTEGSLLNNNDQIGQMNNLIADSRQLLFDSRNVDRQILKEFPHLKSLADSLLQESQNNTDIVAKASEDLSESISSQVAAKALDANRK